MADKKEKKRALWSRLGMKWSLTKKLTGWGCVMALIVLALSAYSMHRLDVIEENSDRSYKEAMLPLRDCARFVMAFSTVVSLVNEHIAVSEATRMDEIETEMKSKLKAADGLLSRLGSQVDVGEVQNQWKSVTTLLKEVVSQSKGFRKFEALSAMNGGEGLQQILALNKGVSDLLAQTIQRAEHYQKRGELLGARTMFVASVLALLLSVLIAVLLARSIGRPLKVLASVAERISGGDLTVEMPASRRGDEIGILGVAFTRMLASLKDQSSKMQGVVGSLSSVASELSTTMSQLVQNSTNTASSVSQVSATATEVSQSAKVASDKAKNVVKISQEALEISDSGSRATQQTAEKINFSREQMQSISETVITLSEQSQAIETIVGSVQDLADQSNLLAVNASIEAARAGSYGKGFAVVAQEIKSLADASRVATDEIGTILYDVKKWVGAVVEATEQGTIAVESGVEQSALAGESIKSLVDIVADSAREAQVISASSEEELVAMEQVSGAMTQIETAMHQNLDGISQVDSAAKELEGLGDTLRDLVEYYRL